MAARGKSSMGWFFGLKLHFVINHKGEIMALKITPGNTADSAALDDITQHLTGKVYADKGYIGKKLFRKLWQRGLHLITGIRRNMKNYRNSPGLGRFTQSGGLRSGCLGWRSGFAECPTPASWPSKAASGSRQNP
jgi:Transposase DDE domain